MTNAYFVILKVYKFFKKRIIYLYKNLIIKYNYYHFPVITHLLINLFSKHNINNVLQIEISII